MNYCSGPGLQVVYDSAWASESDLSAANPTVITIPFRLANATGASVQIFSDGGAAFDYKFQVTNLPRNIIQYGSRVNGATQRDETASSTHWDTTPNGAGSVSSGPSCTTLTLSTSIFREGRIVIERVGGAGKIFAVLATAE